MLSWLFALRKWKLTLLRIFNEIFAPPKTKLGISFLALRNFSRLRFLPNYRGDLKGLLNRDIHRNESLGAPKVGNENKRNNDSYDNRP